MRQKKKMLFLGSFNKLTKHFCGTNMCISHIQFITLRKGVINLYVLKEILKYFLQEEVSSFCLVTKQSFHKVGLCSQLSFYFSLSSTWNLMEMQYRRNYPEAKQNSHPHEESLGLIKTNDLG